jgi:hypothetical protein
MGSSPLALALQIAQLIEANTERDLRAAVALIEEHGIGSPLLDLLTYRHPRASEKPARTNSDARRAAPYPRVSRAISEIRDSDPDKFRLLTEFERMLSRGHVLATFEDLKRFGETISKDFRPRKSRKESIPSLIGLLVQRPTADLEDLIRFAASFGVGADADQYQRLARFLIKGREGT